MIGMKALRHEVEEVRAELKSQQRPVFTAAQDAPEDTIEGNIVLDSNGEAPVELPLAFETLHGEFRYQLTAIGAPGPSLYIAQEVQNGRFKISGGRPGAKVSWRLTGVRQNTNLIVQQ